MWLGTKKRPKPVVSAQGEQIRLCPWFHLNSRLADAHSRGAAPKYLAHSDLPVTPQASLSSLAIYYHYASLGRLACDAPSGVGTVNLFLRSSFPITAGCRSRISARLLKGAFRSATPKACTVRLLSARALRSVLFPVNAVEILYDRWGSLSRRKTASGGAKDGSRGHFPKNPESRTD